MVPVMVEEQAVIARPMIGESIIVALTKSAVYSRRAFSAAALL